MACAATHNSKFLIHNSYDTVVLRDSVLVRDSIVYRQRTVHDTVYITKEVFRDALTSKFLLQNSATTDTVVVTEWRDKIIEHPPERYVPKFYRWCTVVLWAIVVLVVGYKAMRWWLKDRVGV